MSMQMTRHVARYLLLLSFGCPLASAETPPDLDQGFDRILSNHGAATIGAGIVRHGDLVWHGYFGEQAPGVPAGPSTMFNVGSITKTVTAELVVRLANSGVISLGESMSAFWVDPDLVDDPRHQQLTPELAVSHRTGFPNWRYMDPEFKLRFVSDPGTAFGYSGEGMDYVARFLEKKTGEPFSALVDKHVFEAIEIEDISITREDWVIDRLALPVDEKGDRHEPYCSSAAGDYCLSNGDWSAADELATTVEAYAQFMTAVSLGDGISSELQDDRFAIITSHADDPVLGCPFSDTAKCPTNQGYGLGWEIFEFEDAKIVSHGGSDWSERAMAYFDPATGDGIVLFINGPASTSVDALIDGMRLLDPGSRMAEMYQGWMERYAARQ
jgi:CubicO group peptidase (beta-lactamase class C family)